MDDDGTARVSDAERVGDASAVALAPYHILDTPAEAVYDDLVKLASEVCATPVALLTLFETRRQWFKAVVGFDGTETALGDSICQYAIDAGDVLVIADTTLDPRTRQNPFVVGGPEIRFYAGAPLRTPDGTFLGTLCVIDMVARPGGLTTVQTTGLRVLADQVMSTLELRRLLRERDSAFVAKAAEHDRLASSEAHWRGLFEGLREGFLIGRVIRNEQGKVVDWRHLEANQAFVDVSGFERTQVIGRTIRDIAPNIPQPWIDFTAQVVDTGAPATFQQISAANRRQYDGRAFPIGDDQFAVIFLDVTDRTQATRRQAALVAVADQLRDLDVVAEMTQAAARIVGETLGVTRVGYGRLDAARETITLEPDWTAAGTTSIAGIHRFTDYGDLLQELLAGQPLVIADVRNDPRTATGLEQLDAIAVAALVNMPVRERGRTTALLIVHHDRPRAWSEDELTFLRDVADRLELAIGRLDAEAQRVVQNQELSHRVKNTLAMVQAIASQTLKTITERSAVESFEHRLTALATAHDVLLSGNWTAAPLIDTIRSVLDSLGQANRGRLAGPPVELSPRATLSISLLMHELATNALKYGALSVTAGMITINWRIHHRDGRPTLFLDWSERGGPSVTVPTRRGFGSRLINLGLAGTGGVDLSFNDVGLDVRMSAPLDDLTQSDAGHRAIA